MKYNIQINQLALSDTQLDLVDAAILDYLYVICSSPNTSVGNNRLSRDGVDWTWVSLPQLLSQMPLLRIKTTGGISKRLDNIARAGFVGTMNIGRKTYVRLFPTVNKLFLTGNDIVSHRKQNRFPQETDNNTKDNTTKIILSKDKKDSDKRNPDVQQVIDTFQKETGITLTKHQLNRYAAARLVKRYEVHNVLGAIRLAMHYRGKAYRPQVNNIMDLEDKWAMLMSHYQKDNQSVLDTEIEF